VKVTVLRPTSDVVLIVLVGELDTVTAPHWSTVLHRELDSRPKVVVFDLGAVSFFGVAALRVLRLAAKRAQRLAVEVNVIYRDRTPVHASLLAGGLTPIFPPFRTIAGAPFGGG
jgi:anti-anti-sigma factor